MLSEDDLFPLDMEIDDLLEDAPILNPNLYYERPAASAGFFFYYIWPFQENMPFLFLTGSGDSEQ